MTLREFGINSSNTSASRTVDQPVAVAPHDQCRAGDLGQALAEVVVEHRLEALQEAGLAGAAQLLGGQRGGQATGVAHDDVQRAPRADARGGRQRRIWRRPDAGPEQHTFEAAQRGHEPRRGGASAVVDRPAAETSTSRSTRCGKAIASSAAMKPPIELPTTAAASIPSSSEQALEQARIAGDRDLARRGIGE